MKSNKKKPRQRNRPRNKANRLRNSIEEQNCDTIRNDIQDTKNTADTINSNTVIQESNGIQTNDTARMIVVNPISNPNTETCKPGK